MPPPVSPILPALLISTSGLTPQASEFVVDASRSGFVYGNTFHKVVVLISGKHRELPLSYSSDGKRDFIDKIARVYIAGLKENAVIRKVDTSNAANVATLAKSASYDLSAHKMTYTPVDSGVPSFAYHVTKAKARDLGFATLNKLGEFMSGAMTRISTHFATIDSFSTTGLPFNDNRCYMNASLQMLFSMVPRDTFEPKDGDSPQLIVLRVALKTINDKRLDPGKKVEEGDMEAFVEAAKNLKAVKGFADDGGWEHKDRNGNGQQKDAQQFLSFIDEVLELPSPWKTKSGDIPIMGSFAVMIFSEFLDVGKFVSHVHDNVKDGSKLPIPVMLPRTNLSHEKDAVHITMPMEVKCADEAMYRAKSCIKHVGADASGGHYISFVERSGMWFKQDDDKVAEQTFEQVQKEMETEGYLIAYEWVQSPVEQKSEDAAIKKTT